MPLIKLDEIECYYESHGQGEPMVLISGYTGDHSFWIGVLPYLTKHFNVIVFDNRAIGQTKDNGQAFTMADLANDVVKLMTYLGFKQFHVVGQSMGGGIAQSIAIYHPRVVKKLIILNSVFKFNEVATLALKNTLTMRKMNLPLNFIIDCVIPWVFSSDFLKRSDNAKLFREAVQNDPNPQSLTDQTRQLAAIETYNEEANIAKITAPTLVIAAAEDRLTLTTTSQALAQAIAGSLFKVIPGAHASPVEQPKLVADLITDFVKN